jgi:hypothetical protein
MKEKISFLTCLILLTAYLNISAVAQSPQEDALKISDILKNELALSNEQYNSVYEILLSYFKDNNQPDLKDESLLRSLKEVVNENQFELYNNLSVKLNYMIDNYRKPEGNLYQSYENANTESYSLVKGIDSENKNVKVESKRDNRNEVKSTHENVNEEIPSQEMIRIESEGGIIEAK